jgi:hypothetical protein
MTRQPNSSSLFTYAPTSNSSRQQTSNLRIPANEFLSVVNSQALHMLPPSKSALRQLKRKIPSVTFRSKKRVKRPQKSRRTWTVPTRKSRALDCPGLFHLNRNLSIQRTVFPSQCAQSCWFVMRQEVLKHCLLQHSASNYGCSAKTNKRASKLILWSMQSFEV